jgi:hypothetical protein
MYYCSATQITGNSLSNNSSYLGLLQHNDHGSALLIVVSAFKFHDHTYFKNYAKCQQVIL